MDKKGRTNRLLSRLAVGLMLAAMALFTGCPNKITVKPVTFEVTFSAGEHGTLKAKSDGIAETETSPITIEQGKTVTFRATPDSGYRVKGWTRDGETVNGTNDFYSFTVTKGVEVKVSFESNSVPPIPPASGPYDFVEITPPAAGITGKDPTYTLPGTQDYWKGVFREGRKVTLSPYKLGKTEVPYEVWYEVRTWAETKGYTFANKGLEGWDGSGGGGSYPNYTNIGKSPTANKNHPVIMISWRDCIVWCNAYTHKIKGEGECVYRKSKTDTTVLKDATKGSECDAAYADMSKNDAAYTSGGFVVDPQGAASGVSRVFRGGSWSDYAYNCGVGIRFSVIPAFRRYDLGFRVACRP